MKKQIINKNSAKQSIKPVERNIVLNEHRIDEKHRYPLGSKRITKNMFCYNLTFFFSKATFENNIRSGKRDKRQHPRKHPIQGLSFKSVDHRIAEIKITKPCRIGYRLIEPKRIQKHMKKHLGSISLDEKVTEK